MMTSEGSIANIGLNLARGTLISIVLVMFVLPQTLLIGSRIIDRTSFSVPKVLRKKNTSGHVVVDGVVSGEVHGTISGIIRGTIEGDVNLNLISGSIQEEGEEKNEQENMENS